MSVVNEALNNQDISVRNTGVEDADVQARLAADNQRDFEALIAGREVVSKTDPTETEFGLTHYRAIPFGTETVRGGLVQQWAQPLEYRDHSSGDVVAMALVLVAIDNPGAMLTDHVRDTRHGQTRTFMFYPNWPSKSDQEGFKRQVGAVLYAAKFQAGMRAFARTMGQNIADDVFADIKL